MAGIRVGGHIHKAAHLSGRFVEQHQDSACSLLPRRERIQRVHERSESESHTPEQRLEFRREPLPTPGAVPCAVHQSEGRHRANDTPTAA